MPKEYGKGKGKPIEPSPVETNIEVTPKGEEFLLGLLNSEMPIVDGSGYEVPSQVDPSPPIEGTSEPYVTRPEFENFKKWCEISFIKKPFDGTF